MAYVHRLFPITPPPRSWAERQVFARRLGLTCAFGVDRGSAPAVTVPLQW